MDKTRRPKISFDTDPDTYERYQRIEWGVRGRLMTYLTNQILDAVEMGGQVMIYMLISRKLKVKLVPVREGEK